VSAHATRADAIALEDHTARGNIHVFTSPEAGVVEVSFYIDDPGRTRTPYRIEKTAPFDMAGGSVAVATPYDTRTIADATHSVTAVLRLASGGTEVVGATFQVRNASPALELVPGSLAFAARQGDPAASQSVALQASDGSSPSYTLADDATWLSVTPVSGSAPAGLTVTANPAGLAPGTYTGALSATAAGYQAATLRVTLTVATASSYRLLVSQSANRSAPVDLHGRTVSGAIYAFTSPDDGVSAVAFYVDDPDRTRSPHRTEKAAPFDLGGGSVTLASPFATTSLTDGQHTINAVLTNSAGGSEVVTATFSVDN
jgi:hypothetical protein